MKNKKECMYSTGCSFFNDRDVRVYIVRQKVKKENRKR